MEWWMIVGLVLALLIVLFVFLLGIIHRNDGTLATKGAPLGLGLRLSGA
jgi:hypothetical protein